MQSENLNTQSKNKNLSLNTEDVNSSNQQEEDASSSDVEALQEDWLRKYEFQLIQKNNQTSSNKRKYSPISDDDEACSSNKKSRNSSSSPSKELEQKYDNDEDILMEMIQEEQEELLEDWIQNNQNIFYLNPVYNGTKLELNNNTDDIPIFKNHYYFPNLKELVLGRLTDSIFSIKYPSLQKLEIKPYTIMDSNILINILYNAPNLEELYISNNIITELTENLYCNLNELKILNISNIKELKTVPTWILNMTNLEQLSITGTSINQLPNLSELQKLKILDLSNNSLKTLPDDIQHSPTIEQLFLGNNPKLSDDSFNLSQMNNLSIISIYDTKLKLTNISNSSIYIFNEIEYKIWNYPTKMINSFTSHKAVFSKRELVHILHNKNCKKENIPMLIDKLLENAKPLGINIRNQTVYTGERYQQLEKDVLSQFKTLANERSKILCDNSIIENVMEKYNYFSEEQRNAVKALTSTRNFDILIGKAGAGKTTTMKAVADIYKLSNANVIGMSLSAIASENLAQEAGIVSRTIASWIFRYKQCYPTKYSPESSYESHKINPFMQDEIKPDVIIIDEAGMVGTKNWYDILDFAHQFNSKIIAIGDDNQIKPISSGDCFRAALESLNSIAHLNEIRRQKEDWQKTASIEFSKLNVMKALAYYDQHNKIYQMYSIAQVVEQFLDIEPKGSTVILCATRNECTEFNKLIHKIKKEQNILHQDVLTIGNNKFSINETIMFTKNNKSLDVKNGEIATIIQYNQDMDLLIFKSGDKKKYIQSSILKDPKSFFFKQIDYAYAITIAKSQGKTYDYTFVLANSIMDAKDTYVAMTRHRNNVTLFYKTSQFRDVNHVMKCLAKYHQKDLAKDYIDTNSKYRSLVQEYSSLLNERSSVLQHIHKGKATWQDYSQANTKLSSVGKKIAQDFEPHKLFLNQRGVTQENLEIQCNLREQPLSNLELQAKNRVEKYIQLNKLIQDFPKEKESSMKEYHNLLTKRNQLIQEILDNYNLHYKFIKLIVTDYSMSKESLKNQLSYDSM